MHVVKNYFFNSNSAAVHCSSKVELFKEFMYGKFVYVKNAADTDWACSSNFTSSIWRSNIIIRKIIKFITKFKEKRQKNMILIGNIFFLLFFLDYVEQQLQCATPRDTPVTNQKNKEVLNRLVATASRISSVCLLINNKSVTTEVFVFVSK